MPKQPTGGQDEGAWFLEAVGATSPKPTGSEALSELTKENSVVDADGTPSEGSSPDSETPDATPTPAKTGAETTGESTRIVKTTQVTFSSFDGDPGTANSTFAPIRGDRALDVGSLPPPAKPTPSVAPVVAAGATAVMASASSPAQPAPAPPAAPAAAPEREVDPELARQVRSDRSFRWPIVAVVVLIAVAIGVAAFWLPRAMEAEAIATRQTYYDATAAVRNHLPASQAALDVITNPASTNDQLNGSIPAIAQLDTLAFAMRDAAAEPLPTALPLLPKDAITALEPLQETTALLGEEGDGIAKRLGNAYIYRISIPVLLSPGNLPISAGTETINTISVTLAASLADDAAVVAELPDDPTFATVQTLAIDSHARYATWQTEYLAALTSGDSDAAQTLIDELNAMREALNDANGAALASFRLEMDSQIVTYAVELEVHMTALTQS